MALNPGGLGPIAIGLGGFLLFLTIALLIGLLFALAAVIVVIYLVTVMAPLVLVLGHLEPLRWLQWMITTIAATTNRWTTGRPRTSSLGGTGRCAHEGRGSSVTL